jgi:hypothetical protein
MTIHVLRERTGQALIEYVLAMTLMVAVAGSVGLLVRDAQRSATGGLHRQTFLRAPYTVTTSVGASGQCVKDVLMH